jgi:preprotein translocase subunit YajC
MIGLIIIVLLFLFVYLAVLRPQRRRRVAEAERLKSVAVGDEVITAGGIYGSVTGFEGDDLLVEIAPSLEVRVARRAIAAIVPPDEPDVSDDTTVPDGIEAPEPDGSYSEGPR